MNVVNEVHVTVADPFPNQELTPEHVWICCDQSIPRELNVDKIGKLPPMRKLEAFYVSEAKLIVDALWSCLPGGTLDAMLRLMLERRASLLRVKFRED